MSIEFYREIYERYMKLHKKFNKIIYDCDDCEIVHLTEKKIIDLFLQYPNDTMYDIDRNMFFYFNHNILYIEKENVTKFAIVKKLLPNF